MEISLHDLLKEKQKTLEDFYNRFENRESIVEVKDCFVYIDYCVVRKRYKLSTSEKRWLVRTLEQWNSKEFYCALTESRSAWKRCRVLLGAISFGRFSRSVEHRTIVKDVTIGNFRTAECILNESVKNGDLKSVETTLAKYHNLALKRAAWCYQQGIPGEILEKAMEACSLTDLLKAVTVLSKTEIEEGVQVHARQALISKAKTLGYDLKWDSELILSECYFGELMTWKIDGIRFVRIAVERKDGIGNSIDLITTKDENGIITILGNGVIKSRHSSGKSGIEYVDIDLENVNGILNFGLHLYSGRNFFSQVQFCEFTISEITSLGGKIKSVIFKKRICNHSGFVDLGFLKTVEDVSFSFMGKSAKYSITRLLTGFKPEWNYSIQDFKNDLEISD